MEPGTSPARRSTAWRWFIPLGFVFLVLIAGVSALGGYRSGIDQRTSLEATQVSQHIHEQFELGLQDLEAKRYDAARQRFEYVIRLDPNYPGVTDKLAAVLLELNTTATPTPVPTPTLTPTPDMRGVEDLFSQASEFLANSDWSNAIDTLLKLRKDDPDYQAVKVDAMLYVALRNRGVYKILNQADLEGGTYDLALAERFGLLDVEADNYRKWADFYVTGASFWELDWRQAAHHFGLIVQVAPNLRDASNMTARQRFLHATIKYADILAENGEYCLAQEQYEIALNSGADPSLQETATWAADRCSGGAGPDEGEAPAEPPAEATPTAPEQPGTEGTPTPEPAEPTAEPAPTEEAAPTPEE